jgi:hypothetical protein
VSGPLLDIITDLGHFVNCGQDREFQLLRPLAPQGLPMREGPRISQGTKVRNTLGQAHFNKQQQWCVGDLTCLHACTLPVAHQEGQSEQEDAFFGTRGRGVTAHAGARGHGEPSVSRSLVPRRPTGTAAGHQHHQWSQLCLSKDRTDLLFFSFDPSLSLLRLARARLVARVAVAPRARSRPPSRPRPDFSSPSGVSPAS